MRRLDAGRRAQRFFFLRGRGGWVSRRSADATDESSVAQLLDAARKEAGSLDVVVYNAGNMRVGTLVDMETDAFESTWRTTCLGGFLVGREAAQRMLPQGHGTLIFTGATASLRARPPFAAFASAKAALRALAFGLARELGPQGIHVGHVVVDGVIAGDQVLERFPQIEEQLGRDGMLAIDAIADAYWTLHGQDRTAWTLELDLRPYKERF